MKKIMQWGAFLLLTGVILTACGKGVGTGPNAVTDSSSEDSGTVLMATSVSPGCEAEANLDSTYNFTNAGYACADETTAAYATVSTNGTQQIYKNFSIPAIPAGSIINGIKVSVKAKSNIDKKVRKFNVELSSNGGDSVPSWTTSLYNTEANFGTDDTTNSAGSSTSLWGRTSSSPWSANDFTNDNFRVRLEANIGDGVTLSLNYLQVTVYYGPIVTSTIPANNATEVDINSTIKATFNYDIGALTINTSTFTLSNGGSVSGTVTYAAATKTATFTPSASLSYSTKYTATIKGGTYGVKDSYGTAMAADYTWSFTTHDGNAPTGPSISINSGDASTTSPSVTLTLSATDDVGVTAYYASETSTPPLASASGWDSVTPTTSYSDSVSFTLSSGSGTKTVYVWFKDAAGNISLSANDSISLSVSDTTAPSDPTSLTSDHDTSTWSSNNSVKMTWSGATDEVAVAGYWILWDTSSSTTPTSSAPATWVDQATDPHSYTSSVADGNSNYFHLKTCDTSNNCTGTLHLGPFYIDTTPPDTSIDSGPANPSNSNSASFTFSGTDTGSGVASFECDLDGGGFSTCTSAKSYSSLSEGSHTFQVRAKDGVGNTDPTSASQTWFVDTVKPDGTVNVAYTYSPYVKGAVTISGTFSDPAPSSGIDTASSYLDIGGTQVFLNTIITTAGSYSHDWVTGDNGPVPVSLYVKDNAGNDITKEADPTPIVDNAAPTIDSVTTDKLVYDPSDAITVTASGVEDNTGGSGVKSVSDKLTGTGIETQGPNPMYFTTDPTIWKNSSLLAVVGWFDISVQATDYVSNASDWEFMVDPTGGRYTTSTTYTGDTSVASGNIANFSAKLALVSLVPEGQDSPVLSGETIIFTLSSGTTLVWGPVTATTDNSGIASLSNVVALPSGSYTLKADYAGNDSKLLGNSSATMSPFVVVNKANAGGWIIGNNPKAKNPKATFGLISLYATGGDTGWSGSIQFNDHSTGNRFHKKFSGAAVNTEVQTDGIKLTITGDDWTLTIIDKGEPGINDQFGISFQDYSIGPKTLGDPVKLKGGGNIKVR